MKFTRRSILQFAGASTAAGLAPARSATPKPAPAMRLGVVKKISGNPEPEIRRVHELRFPTCMVFPSDLSPAVAGRLKQALNRYQVEATALVVLGPGRMVWDLVDGPATIGLVPETNRRARIEAMKHASEFAKLVGIPAIQTHCGFIPEVPSDPQYASVVEAIREVAGYCRANGQMFLCETGQETPVTLLRAITDAGLDNIGVGLDTANLVLYGKGNPLDALDVLGSKVRSIMAKDGRFPTNPRQLGEEVPIGQGKVDFGRLIPALGKIGYRGAITIEREITGPQQTADVVKAKADLEGIIRGLESKAKS